MSLTPVTCAAFANCDDAVVFWRIAEPIPNCVGFALERQTRQGENGQNLRSFVHNRTGFSSAPGTQGEHRPSTEWPFQRFSWTDHLADLGDRVSYRVIPVVEIPAGQLNLAVDFASAWTPELVLSGDTDPNFSFFFNRGLVISQFMSRYLAAMKQTPTEPMTTTLARFKSSLQNHEEPIRRFLAGELGKELLKLLAEIKASDAHVFLALYELSDDELITALEALKARAHVVLSNGASRPDENADARTRLGKAGVDIHDRMVAKGISAHNKFMVLCDANQAPLSVWTGSTNWQPTGLCTQINNGLLVNDAPLAQHYLDQWKRLKAAGDGFPAELVSANTTPKTFAIGNTQTTAWFSRTHGGEDLDALEQVVNEARDGILFLMFMPGPTPLGAIRRRMADENDRIYIKGVANQLPKTDDESQADVETLSSDHSTKTRLNIVQPVGNAHPFANWAQTVSRPEFKTVGIAIIHSKVLVIDPFTHPVVVTGSHNFSGNASEKNDENFLIIRNNPMLSQAYAVHVLAVYQHYRWLAYVNDKQKHHQDPWSGLTHDPAWQNDYLAGPRLQEMNFWLKPGA